MSQHRAVLTGLVQQHGWTSGVELGVDKGILFGQLLRTCLALHLTGVDVFPIEERRDRCFGIVHQFPERASLLYMAGHDATVFVEDRSQDFVFIDADHAETSVREDIADWQPKVKSGGWLGGHDYNRKFPGVMTAVDCAFGRKVQAWPGSIWGVWQ